MPGMGIAALDIGRLTEIDRLAERELAGTGVPGIAIGLTGPDGSTDVRTYGLAALAARRPIERDTLFEIGSIGKTFTAIAIVQLAEEGRLDLHAPVTDSLSWFAMPVVGRTVTIHDLLTHTAGITAGIDGTPEAAFQVWALRDRVPGSAPGERFHYSNVGYKVLGLVLEALEGRPYPEVIRARILDPLGMTATEPAITHAIRPRLAVGYDYRDDDRLGYPGRPLAEATWLETATADGSLASTAGDMVTFARLLLRRGQGPQNRLVSEASFALMAQPHARPTLTDGYGYGMATRVTGGRAFLGHGGGMVGFVAGLQVEPAADLGVVVLENGLMGRPMTLARAILTTLGAEEAARRTVSATADPAAADRASAAGASPPDARDAAPVGHIEPDRTGTYRMDHADRHADALEIVAGPGGPALRRQGHSHALEALGDGRYLVPDPDFDRFALCFEPADGRPAVVWHGPTRFIRDGAAAPPLTSPGPAVAGMAGHYRSHNPWTTNFRIIFRGDVPWLVFVAGPDGFEDEQPLTARPDGSFLVGDDQGGPEDLRFDATVAGRPLRAWLSGFPYYRVD